MACCEVTARAPRDRDIVYDPQDPDRVEIGFIDGRVRQSEISLPTGTPARPLSEAARRAKFDTCVAPLLSNAGCESLWTRLNSIDGCDNLRCDLPW